MRDCIGDGDDADARIPGIGSGASRTGPSVGIEESIMSVETIHVLIVEDSEDCAMSVQKILEARKEVSFTVEIVGTVGDAVRRLRCGGIDAVLLDLSLPDGDGVDVV